MKSFMCFIETSLEDEDRPEISSIRRKLDEIGSEVEALAGALTHGDEVVLHAKTHFENAVRALLATLRTANRKNAENPERGDHPPRSIQ